MKRFSTLFLRSILVCACMLGLALPGQAAFPDKSVTVIVPYAAGGTTDLSTRTVLESIDPKVIPSGVSFLVTNMPGGSGLVGANKFATSKPDGYTLGIVNCDLLLNSSTGKTQLKLSDFIPLAFIQADPYMVLVKADSPFKTFQEFIDYAKKNPGKLVIGDSGPGAVPHLGVVAMEKSLGVKFKTVGYDSSGDSSFAVVRGEVDATVAHSGAAIGQLNAGALRALAVTSAHRLKAFPDVPGIGELYKEAADMEILSWISVAALAKTDPKTVDYLKKALSDAVKSDNFRTKIKSFYMEEVNMNPAEVQQFFKDQSDYYIKITK